MIHHALPALLARGAASAQGPAPAPARLAPLAVGLCAAMCGVSMGGGRDVGAAGGGTLGWSEGARAVRLAGGLVAALVLFSRALASGPPCRPQLFFYLCAVCLAAAGLPRAGALVELNVEIGFRRGMPVVEESNFATHCPRAYAGQGQAPPPASSRRSGGGGRGGAGAAHGHVAGKVEAVEEVEEEDKAWEGDVIDEELARWRLAGVPLPDGAYEFLKVCVCVCVCVYVFIHIVYVCMYVCIYVCMSIYIHISICMYVCIYLSI